MTANLLTLNSPKTEFLLIGPRTQLDKTHNSSLNISFVVSVLTLILHSLHHGHLHRSLQTRLLQFSVYYNLPQITRLAADDSDVSGLQCLLDLTVAFNTVDRDLLMLRLERQFGHRGFVLQWFSSYLSDRNISGRVWR